MDKLKADAKYWLKDELYEIPRGCQHIEYAVDNFNCEDEEDALNKGFCKLRITGSEFSCDFKKDVFAYKQDLVNIIKNRLPDVVNIVFINKIADETKCVSFPASCIISINNFINSSRRTNMKRMVKSNRKLIKSASLSRSEREGVEVVLSYITGILGDDDEIARYDVIRNTLSDDEMKRLEDVCNTFSDSQNYGTISTKSVKDDIPLLCKVYDILDKNDLLEDDYDAMSGFEKLCLESSRAIKSSYEYVWEVGEKRNIPFENVKDIFEGYGYGEEEADDFWNSKMSDVSDTWDSFPELKKMFGWKTVKSSVNDYVNAQRTIVNIIKKHNRENRNYEYTQRVKNNDGDVSDMFPMNVKPDDFTKNGDYLDAVSVIENFTGKPFDLEEFKRKNASSINSSRINIKEKIMNRTNMKRMVKSGYSNNPDYVGDWFGKGQIDFDAIINPEDEGDLWMVKLWSGSGYVLDVYLCKATGEYDAIDKVFDWSYENEGANKLVFDFDYVIDDAHKEYEDYKEHSDWFRYGDALSEDDFIDRYIDEDYVSEDDFIDRYIDENYVSNENYELFAYDENFFVARVPDEVLAENRGSVQNSRKSKKGKSVKSNRKLIKSYGGFDEQNDCIVGLEICIGYDRLYDEYDQEEVNRITDDFEKFVENWFSDKIGHVPVEEFHDDYHGLSVYNVGYWVPRNEVNDDMNKFSWDDENILEGDSHYYMNLNGSELSFSGFGKNYENEELVDDVIAASDINVIVYDMELVESSRRFVKSNVELRRFAKKVGKGWFMGDYDSNTGVITVTKIAPTVRGVNIGDEFTYDDIESIGYEDITEGINIESSRKSIKSSVDSSTVADILKARKEVKEVEDRGDEVIAYLHKDYRDVDADRLADEVLGTIETKYDDFTWDYSPAWMDYNGDEYDDTYAVILEKKEIESACHGKKKNKKKGKSVKSNRKQIKSGRFIKSGAGAGYDVTIEGIELDDGNYRIISDEVTNEKYNEHTTMVEVPVKPCVVEKWSAEDYYYGVSSEGLYVDGELVQEYFDDDKRVNGGKAVLRIIWYLGDYKSAEEVCDDVIPRDININAGFGGGWLHVYLPEDEIHFEDKYHGYPIDAGEPYDYETMSVDLVCPNISENINWYFKHDHELEEIFFGEGEENDDELFNSIERNQKNLNKIFR